LNTTSTDARDEAEPTMIERLLSAALTFSLLAGGTYAVGFELFAGSRAAPPLKQAATVELPRVEVTGRRPTGLVALGDCDTTEPVRLQ
jgi:hypothetical protein